MNCNKSTCLQMLRLIRLWDNAAGSTCHQHGRSEGLWASSWVAVWYRLCGSTSTVGCIVCIRWRGAKIWHDICFLNVYINGWLPRKRKIDQISFHDSFPVKDSFRPARCPWRPEDHGTLIPGVAIIQLSWPFDLLFVCQGCLGNQAGYSAVLHSVDREEADVREIPESLLHLLLGFSVTNYKSCLNLLNL